jgi:hypothetical protein
MFSKRALPTRSPFVITFLGIGERILKLGFACLEMCLSVKKICYGK